MDFLVESNEKYAMIIPQVADLEGVLTTALKQKIVELSESGFNQIIVNFSKVNFVDSAGLGALVSGMKIMRLKNGDLVLSELNPNVYSLFELTRLNQVFKIFSNNEEAINNFEK